MKINNKKQDHNIGSHAEKMVKRKLLRNARISRTPVRTGKYIPEVEDRKHHGI